MSVWPETVPAHAALLGNEGELISISIAVDPRHLESLLEALAQVSFPVNPQIYHDACLVYRYADRADESVPVTLVEFPAYGSRLDEVRHAVTSYGFDPASVHASAMLDELQTDCPVEPAPDGAPYLEVCRRKYRAAAAVN
jgi:hypothetical protein